MEKAKEKKFKLSDFDIFNERAAQGREVARAIDDETSIPFSTTITAQVSQSCGSLQARRSS
jgi:hypothetical protein